MKSKVEILYKYPENELLLGRIAQTCTGYDDKFEVYYDEYDHMQNILDHCYKLKHMSVFEFGGIVFRLHIPIYVARQLMRYRSSTFMERSLRYCKPIELTSDDDWNESIYNNAVALYKSCLDNGSKKEEARAVLPLCTPTILVWKINCRSLFHVFDERLAPSAQGETREVVREMKRLFKLNFPALDYIYEKYDDIKKGY